MTENNLTEDTFVDDSEENDSLFEESVLNSSFGSSSSYSDSEFSSGSSFEDDYDDTLSEVSDLEYNPGDLVNLRGLFDEDAVDSRNVNATLDFEEIPDDIDIDEPVEIENLSRAGRIMNVVVKATLIIFALIVLGFIINAGLVIGAVLSSNFQVQVFVDVSKLDQSSAQINAVVMTDISNFGSFIVGELEPKSLVSAHVYLSNDEKPKHDDAIFEISYMPPDDVIKFNGGRRQIFNLEKIEMKLNPNFDSSRLSGFMEPRNGDNFHERYPRNLIVHFSVNFVINSFWVPIPYSYDMLRKFELDKIDVDLEQKRAKQMKEFDFNPKFVDISEPEGDTLKVKIRQPIPKFFVPPSYKIAVHVPEMEFVSKQFTMKYPQLTPNIYDLFNDQSSSLAKVKVKPFRMILEDDDMTPNILDIEAEIHKNDLDGLINVLKAIRDEKLGTLAFLFASKEFHPEEEVVVDESIVDKDATGTVESESQKLEPKSIVGCNLIDFMKTFWGRQAFPVADDSAEIPSVPELYDPSKDSAIKFEFNGIVDNEETQHLSFRISANKHFVISEYKLPLLMLSGELPPIDFKMILKTSTTRHPEIANFKVIHRNFSEIEEKTGVKPLGKNLIFDVLVEIKDLKLLSHFALKLQRMSQVNLVQGTSMEQVIGRMFRGIEGAEILADFDESNWVSKIASVFDMKFDLSGDKIEFLYLGNGKSIIKESKPKALPIHSEEAEDELLKKLNNLLDLKDLDEDDTENYYKELWGRVKTLKNEVREAEFQFQEASKSIEDLSVESKALCEKDLKASEASKKGSSAKELVDDSDKMTNLQNLTLDHHEKLSKVRKLLTDRIELIRTIPAPKQIIQNGLFAKVDSDDREIKVKMGYSFHKNERLYYDHIQIKWKDFILELDDHRNVHLGSLKSFAGSVDYSLSDGMFFARKSETNGGTVSFEASFGPNSEDLIIKDWMRSFRTFYNAVTDPENIFVPFNLRVKFKELSYSLKGELPAAGVPALPQASVTKLNELVVPGFFDNLSKSYFDFIGYGFYQLIFHAILPNPDTCPAGSSLLNVELNLPPTSTFLFASADSGDLKDATCVASINTSRPLRLWTQIVDGVLCNGYAVAEGLEEQVIASQARISREKSTEIIDSFDQVLQLRKLVTGTDSEVTDISRNIIPSEYPFLNDHTPADIDLEEIPIHKRFALITAVPVNIEILNFEHLIKIIDAFGDKLHVTFNSNDPTIAGFKGREEVSLFNIVVSAVASRFPLEFNTPEQVQLAALKPSKVVHIKNDTVILDISTTSATPSELSVDVNIMMPNRITSKDSEGDDSDSDVYLAHELLSEEKRFLYPIIRWGQTSLQFTFPKFKLSLDLSPGDIKITNDGDKIIFGALSDFKAAIKIKSRSESKSFNETFKTVGIRKVFKKCQDYYNEEIKYEFKEGNVISTASSVEFGSRDNQKFNFTGLADIESFYLLQAVVLRRMFKVDSNNSEDYDPFNDPTLINFGMLISLGDGEEGIQKSRIPTLALPCFFTNFCSAEQLSYTSLNEKGLLLRGSGLNHIPVKLHIRDTFQPITASIAAGFSTFLTLFHMESYPKTLIWKLQVLDEQVVGLEMNGQGMFVGLAGPLEIEKRAVIPYENGLNLNDRKRYNEDLSDIDSDIDSGSGSDSDNDDSPSNFSQFINYSETSKFDKHFNKKRLHQKFKDEVIIPVKVQAPDSLPDLLRKMMWPLFFLPMDTITLHPPLMNVEKSKPDKLAHPPLATALSDSMTFKDSRGNLIRPTLLSKLFSAFIEETSSSGLDSHSLDDPEPSCYRFHLTSDRLPKGNFDLFTGILALLTELLTHNSGSLDFTIWIQFPWAMGSIGFDFGSVVEGIITYADDSEGVLLTGQMTHHHMIGDVARIRLDLSIPLNAIPRVIPLLVKLFLKYCYKFIDESTYRSLSTLIPDNLMNLDILNVPLSAEFNVDDNFIAKTEFFIPRKLIDTPALSNARSARRVELHHTRKDVRWIIEKYGKSAPQAIACIYNRSITEQDRTKQSTLWTKLDLSLTRIYFNSKISAVKPDKPFQLFLQLRTFDQVPVCGLLDGIKELAIKLVYIKPSRGNSSKSRDSVNDSEDDDDDYDVIYKTAQQNLVTSVFTTELNIERSGRFKIFVALRKQGDGTGLSKLRYKEIKFAEIYVENAR